MWRLWRMIRGVVFLEVQHDHEHGEQKSGVTVQWLPVRLQYSILYLQRDRPTFSILSSLTWRSLFIHIFRTKPLSYCLTDRFGHQISFRNCASFEHSCVSTIQGIQTIHSSNSREIMINNCIRRQFFLIFDSKKPRGVYKRFGLRSPGCHRNSN